MEMSRGSELRHSCALVFTLNSLIWCGAVIYMLIMYVDISVPENTCEVVAHVHTDAKLLAVNLIVSYLQLVRLEFEDFSQITQKPCVISFRWGLGSDGMPLTRLLFSFYTITRPWHNSLGFMAPCQAGGGGGESGCHAGVKKAGWTKTGWYVPSANCLLVNRHQNGNLCWHLCYHTGEHAPGKGSDSFLRSSEERRRGRFVIPVLTGLVVPVRSPGFTPLSTSHLILMWLAQLLWSGTRPGCGEGNQRAGESTDTSRRIVRMVGSRPCMIVFILKKNYTS